MPSKRSMCAGRRIGGLFGRICPPFSLASAGNRLVLYLPGKWCAYLSPEQAC